MIWSGVAAVFLLATAVAGGIVCDKIFPACLEMAFGIDVTTFSPDAPNTGNRIALPVRLILCVRISVMVVVVMVDVDGEVGRLPLPVIQFTCDLGQGIDGYQIPDQFPPQINPIAGRSLSVCTPLFCAFRLFLHPASLISRDSAFGWWWRWRSKRL
jgi:hypothetical protein